MEGAVFCCLPLATLTVGFIAADYLFRTGKRRAGYTVLGFLLAGLGAMFSASVVLFVDKAGVPWGHDWGDRLIAGGGVAGALGGAFATYLIARHQNPARVRERRERAADYDDAAVRRPDRVEDE